MIIRKGNTACDGPPGRAAAFEGEVFVDTAAYGGPWEAVPEGGPDASQEELGDIIGGLSRLFFSTYYINLDQDTFRPVTQLRRVGEVLGNEVNCTSALRIYAQYFVHPDDQAEYLRVMNVGYMRQELRWWKPCVAVEYRRRGEEPDGWSWVRASAVLARAGEDEQPLTAVYVAQDISSGRRLPDMGPSRPAQPGTE